jgi:primosomal protein N' (replication factor Y)
MAGWFSSEADDETVRSVVRVALPLPVDTLFDYTVPPEMADRAQPGHRVRVSAGRQRHTGIIVEAAPDPASSPAKLRAIETVLDTEPAIAPPLLAVIRAEAEAVLCPLGVALAAALPPGSAPRAIKGFELTARGRTALQHGAVTGEFGTILTALADKALTEAELRRTATPTPNAVAALKSDGLIAETLLERGPRVRAATVRVAAVRPEVDLANAEALLSRAPRQAALLHLLAERGPTAIATLGEDDPRAGALVRTLEKRGLVEIRHETARLKAALPSTEIPVELTSEQAVACQAIGEAVDARRAETFLLHGVTGSGKTEVYLRAVADALALGRQAIVLVPEITLTHQIIGRLRARFGDELAILHSGLKPGERLAEWERLRRGDTPIAVGARSALFAPVRDLGVIVVDEEHDGAYKSEEGFRFHARQLALRRAEADRCPLILGSATPSLETRFASERGRARHLRLANRIGGRPLPAVRVVDLVKERSALPRGRKLILSTTLVRALRETLGDGAQTILFLNRRGFSTQIACFACQHVERCKNCDIALTYHAGEQRLRCHYCDYEVKPPDHCGECGAEDSALLGIGTERLEEEVRSHFPDARIARLDRDTANRRGATESILQGLGDGSIDVLVGTQMVAKGHDFPGVRLVGIVNADLGLHFPDFRAAERTFQLLTQVSGRAGRAGTPGQVVLQTYAPDHYAIRPVATHDYEHFYAEEIGHRNALGYPPFGRLGLVRLSGEDEARTRIETAALADIARSASAPLGGEVLGPAPAPIARLRGRYRFQLLVRHPEWRRVREILRRVQEVASGLPAGIRASVDANPYDML